MSTDDPASIDADRFARVFEVREPSPEQVTVVRVGGGAYPIITVDDFYLDPHAVRDLVLGLDFSSRRRMYPGHDAFVAGDTSAFLAAFSQITAGQFPSALDPDPRMQPGGLLFSIVTDDLESLQPLQRVPHTDPWRLAAVVYLNLPEQCHGGTGIYRHRETGLEWFPCNHAAARNPRYLRAISRLIDEGRGAQTIERILLEQGLQGISELTDLVYREAESQRLPICGTTEHWQLLHAAEMRFNRLVAYPASLFHTGHAESGRFGVDTATRRLTQNVFINWPRIDLSREDDDR